MDYNMDYNRVIIWVLIMKQGTVGYYKSCKGAPLDSSAAFLMFRSTPKGIPLRYEKRFATLIYSHLTAEHPHQPLTPPPPHSPPPLPSKSFLLPTPNRKNGTQTLLILNIVLYNHFKQRMHIQNLQSQMLQAMFTMAQRQSNYESLNKLIETVWQQPDMLNDSFRIYCNRVADQKTHNTDLPFLVGFYDDMMQNLTGFPQGFLPIYNLFFQSLATEADVAKYTTGPSNYSKLRVFLIVLFWPQLFRTELTKSPLLRFLKLIRALSAEQKECLSHWLVDMQASRFYQTVQFLQTNLSSEIIKLLPDEFDKNDPMEVSQCLMLLSEGISLFSRSNQIFPRIQDEHFLNPDVMKYFSHEDQFNLHIRKINLLNFIRYPFLLDLKYKNTLLAIENNYQQQMNIERVLVNLLNGQIGQNQVVVDQAMMKSLYLQLQINRQNILSDSIEQITNTSLSLKNPLKITFVGQPGNDAGGVKKEYFQLLIKSIFNQNNDMFITMNNNSFYWFNGLSFETPMMFEFIGTVLGLSIYNNTLLDIKFPRLVYKKLISQDQTKLDFIEDVKEIDPDLHRSLRFILESKEPLDDLELVFEGSLVQFGERASFELKPNGSLIKVAQSNKHEYANLISEWVVNKHIEKQFGAFKKGFYRVVTGDMIKLFSPQQLQRVICGSNIIEISELRKGARYGGGFTPKTPVVLHLWEVLEEFNHEQRKAFLSFATGSDRTPVGGLSSLKFIVERFTSDSDMLPNSRTCSNLLLLPEYSSKEKLRQKLLLAIQFKEGFGLI